MKKTMTTSEKFALIRHHGSSLSHAGLGAFAASRSDMLESAERIIEMVKAIPKLELRSED